MKKALLLFSLIGAFSLVNSSCTNTSDDTEEPMMGTAVLSTATVSNVTSGEASSGGTITDDGGFEITERGVVWSTNPSPTTSDSRTFNGVGLGSFVADITGLAPTTTYYLRAYATNSEGTSYGEEVSFTTLELQTYAVGDTGPGGGIVFAVDADGLHGMEIAPVSTEFQSQWGCPNGNVTGTESGVGKGANNTRIILDFHDAINYYNNPSQCTEVVQALGDVAAKNCDDLVFNGFTDWYLPSIDELQLVYQNLHSQGLGDIDTSILSSSTQSTTNIRQFMVFDFNTGGSWPLWKYDLTRHRAIRDF